MEYPNEAADRREEDKAFFDMELERFENLWKNSFEGRGISKSAAFTGYIFATQIGNLMCAIESNDEEDEEWQTKQ